MEAYLQDAIALPPAPTTDNASDPDLRLDVCVSHFQSGANVPLHDIPFAAVMWRPSVTLNARLVLLKSGSLIEQFTITRRLPWIQYFSILFSPFSRGPIRLGFGCDDLLYVLNDACIDLFDQVNHRL